MPTRLEWGVLIVLVLALVQAGLLVLLWLRSRRLQQRLDALWQNAAGTGTDVPTSMLVAALGRMERQLGQVQQSAPVGRAWELAQQLAREGADAEQLMARCGLSSEEAKLVLQVRPPAA